MAGEEKEQEGEGSLGVEYYAPDETPTIFSDSQFVIHTENEFVISFYQTQFPAISDVVRPEGNTVKSRCIVRVVLTPFQMRKFVDAMQSNLTKAIKKKERVGPDNAKAKQADE